MTEWTRRQGRIVAGALFAALALLTLTRLSSFGIWDPWELSAADLARQVAAGEVEALERPPLTLHLIAQGFSLFGVHEWSGRLPMALAGLLALFLGYLLVSGALGRRAGVWALVAAGTTPLFLFNARQMLGAAPAMAATAAVFLCAFSAVFTPAPMAAGATARTRRRVAWGVGLAFALPFATLASGALQGVVPPLLAVAVAIVARGELRRPFADRERAIAAGGVLALALLVTLGTTHAVWADYASFGLWTGGVPRGGAPPTWEVAVEEVFHSFAPWSALLPLALASMLLGGPRAAQLPTGDLRLAPERPEPRVDWPEENALRLALVAWVALGFLAETLFTARYGPATFLPVVGAAAVVAIALRDVERAPNPSYGAAVVAFLFVGLLARDFRGYPGGPVAGLAVEGLEVPEGFDAKIPWALALGVFGLLLALGMAATPRGAEAKPPDPVALLKGIVPTALVRTQWQRGPGFKVWLVLLGLLVVGILGFGLVCWVAASPLEEMGMTSLVVRVGRVCLFVPPGILAAVAAGRGALYGFGRLGVNRLLPAGVAALAVGVYVAHGYQPDLSSHFSPREVYDTYLELAGAGEPLGEFRVGGRAAAYYASDNEVVELDSQPALVQFLQREERVWAAFRADDLAAVDREYRRAAGRHLFIADARSARMLLATNQGVAGRDNQNYLAESVLDEPPTPQHRTQISFDRRIELIGYDLALPGGAFVGPGQAFTITWYFRVTAPVPGGYQPFVHIDGPGVRINGDHEPVGGRYPVRLWEAGDIIADRQELRVPANYRRGALTIYMGFYSGEQRLEVVEGPEDDVNRARVGTIQVR